MGVLDATGRTVKLSLQPRGAVLGGAGVAMLAAGLWRVDGALAALGLAAWCLLAGAWFLARRNTAGLELSLQAPEKTQAGTVFPLILGLSNPRSWLDAFSVRIELELAGQTRCGGVAAWVPAGSAADLELRESIAARAWVERHRARLASDFPLGLFEAERVMEIRHPLCVLPNPQVPQGLSFRGGLIDTPQTESAVAGEAPGEPHGLRPWRPGDAARRIVWPATLRSLARGAGVLVRQTDPPGFRPLRCAVVFHSFGVDGGLIRPDRFEKALSLAAGTLRHLQAQGMEARFIADFDGWRSRPVRTRCQLASCLEVLARARRAPDSEAHDLRAALDGIGEDEGLVVLSDMPAASWRSVVADTGAVLPEWRPARMKREVAR